MTKSNIRVLTKNAKAFHNYFLDDFLEAGIELTGTEIKSLRAHGCDLTDTYVTFRHGEAFVIGMHIAPYEKGTYFNHEPMRERRLLLHKHEIRRYAQKVQEKGLTVIVTRVYLKRGLAKVEIALGRGKKLFDKRETLKKRAIEREMDDARKRSSRGE
ncbi:MAG: SsrA-binding protein SmpB [Bacilli bacterium]|jgi:SsrA-binding protein